MKSESTKRSTKGRMTAPIRTAALGVMLAFMLSACVVIRSSTIGQTTGAGTPVSAEDSDYGILRLSKPSGLIAAANSDLAKQCQSGLLTDVQTQLSMRDWFLVVQYYTVGASAICKLAPPPPPAPQLPVPPHVVLRGVHFDFNKAVIRSSDAATLDEAASTLKDNPNLTVAVDGYCDSIGSTKYNLQLSKRRAEAVVAYLEKEGIPADKLVAHGYGKTNFVASNDTKDGRAQNRRVELVPQQ